MWLCRSFSEYSFQIAACAHHHQTSLACWAFTPDLWTCLNRNHNVGLVEDISENQGTLKVHDSDPWLFWWPSPQPPAQEQRPHEVRRALGTRNVSGQVLRSSQDLPTVPEADRERFRDGLMSPQRTTVATVPAHSQQEGNSLVKYRSMRLHNRLFQFF